MTDIFAIHFEYCEYVVQELKEDLKKGKMLVYMYVSAVGLSLRNTAQLSVQIKFIIL